MDLGGFGQVISGDKAVKVEAQLSQSDLQMAAIYFMVAMFLAVVLANFVVRNRS